MKIKNIIPMILMLILLFSLGCRQNDRIENIKDVTILEDGEETEKTAADEEMEDMTTEPVDLGELDETINDNPDKPNTQDGEAIDQDFNEMDAELIELGELI